MSAMTMPLPAGAGTADPTCYACGIEVACAYHADSAQSTTQEAHAVGRVRESRSIAADLGIPAEDLERAREAATPSASDSSATPTASDSFAAQVGELVDQLRAANDPQQASDLLDQLDALVVAAGGGDEDDASGAVKRGRQRRRDRGRSARQPRRRARSRTETREGCRRSRCRDRQGARGFRVGPLDLDGQRQAKPREGPRHPRRRADPARAAQGGLGPDEHRHHAAERDPS
jgi:hypothetical protein